MNSPCEKCGHRSTCTGRNKECKAFNTWFKAEWPKVCERVRLRLGVKRERFRPKLY